jgi:hypothetical protein
MVTKITKQYSIINWIRAFKEFHFNTTQHAFAFMTFHEWDQSRTKKYFLNRAQLGISVLHYKGEMNNFICQIYTYMTTKTMQCAISVFLAEMVHFSTHHGIKVQIC